ncbi:MAG: MarR family transcriptional regulator [Roseiflexaceae bacterium]
MGSKEEIERAVLIAAREHGIGTILFRNALAKRFGLNLTESLCLTFLGIKGDSSPTELARFTGLSSGATTAMLDRLEQRQFIRRKPRPGDRRGVVIEIDETYAKAAQELVVGVQQAHRDLIASYNAADLAIIADFLQRFTTNLTEHAAKIEKPTE